MLFNTENNLAIATQLVRVSDVTDDFLKNQAFFGWIAQPEVYRIVTVKEILSYRILVRALKTKDNQILSLISLDSALKENE